MSPKVSILIPTYNQAQYVEEAVLSALQQSYENLQVVVADDASSDGTLDILRRLQQNFAQRMTVIAGEQNLGITGNCNRALAVCDGDLIALQGGDDVLLSEKISRQVSWFDANPDGVLCYHDCEVFDSDSDAVICNFSDISRFTTGAGPSRIIRHMRFSAAVSVMVRASAIPAGGFDIRLPMVSDWKLQIDVLAAGGRYGYVDAVLARYRRHSANSRKAFPTRYYQDCLFTVSIVETELFGYSREARLARARIFGLMSIEFLLQDKRRDGRLLVAASLRQGVFSWKFPPLIVFLLLPKSLRGRLQRLLSGRVRSLNYLDA